MADERLIRIAMSLALLVTAIAGGTLLAQAGYPNMAFGVGVACGAFCFLLWKRKR